MHSRYHIYLDAPLDLEQLCVSCNILKVTRSSEPLRLAELRGKELELEKSLKFEQNRKNDLEDEVGNFVFVVFVQANSFF